MSSTTVWMRRAVAVLLVASLGLPSVAVGQVAPLSQTPQAPAISSQPAPGIYGTTPPPGPTVAPPFPGAPPAVPADSFLLRFGGIRPDACAGVNAGLGNVGRVAIPPDYLLGPGDQLDVQLSSRLEVTKQQLVVDSNGFISLPPAGQISVDRLTVADAQQRVNERLRGMFKYTDALLNVPVPRCFGVYITGEVDRPGATLASAMRRIHEVILLSGGITPRGSIRFVELFPKTGPSRTIDLLRFELLGDLSQNPLIEEDLRIHVPPRGGYVTLSGAVRRPGTYELSPGGGLRELLDLMGGASQGAATSRARLTRLASDGRYDTFDVDLALALRAPADVALRAGDVLYIPPGAMLQDVVEVRGALNGVPESARTTITGKPTIVQRFELAKGDRVRDVLVKAGGVSALADLRLAVLERGGSAGPRRQIPIDLQQLLVEKEEFQNILIENGDVLVVPPVEDKVYVLGEVRNPGAVDFRAGMTVREYLALAGGPTIRARFKNAVVTYRDGRTFNVAQAPPIEPGSIVSIPEVSVRWYQDYLLILSAIASLVGAYTGLYILFGGKVTTTGVSQ
jgi:protein involved in polysaccharide export with SLBB domain